MSKNQSPYMLEAASDYLRASRLLWRQPNLSGVAVVNAAIAIEIILKSFIAKPTEKARTGTLSDQYQSNGIKRHTLTDLANDIDREIYQKLGFYEYEESFKNMINNSSRLATLMSQDQDLVTARHLLILLSKCSNQLLNGTKKLEISTHG